MLIQDFLLYFILMVLGVVVLETAVLMGMRIYFELRAKYKEVHNGK